MPTINRRDLMCGATATLAATTLPAIDTIAAAPTGFTSATPLQWYVGLNQRATFRWISSDDIIQGLSPERRAKIEGRARELIGEIDNASSR